MPRLVPSIVAALCCVVGSTAHAASAQPPARPVDFAREVQPILARRCYHCHGPDKAEGGLKLNSHAGVTAKLESGDHAVVANKPEASALIARITTQDEDERMPPEGKPLTAEQIDVLRRWIASGAEWKEPWAYTPVKMPEIPQVQNKGWVKNEIDAFILANLERQGLRPASPASRVALIRRAYYDLTGLPPTPAEVDAFVNDRSPDAYERLIDRLLASPRYGERWARHWLDVVRFAETNSFERDGKKPHAWRYRDYVIRAYNDDKPYDQFVREQIAGDELDPPTADGLIGTGFLRLGVWDDEPADRELAKFDAIDDQVTTVGQGFLGLTMNCARCHDHKIDPIPQRDYYQLAAFFHNLKPMQTTGPNIERPILLTDADRQKYNDAVKALEEKRNAKQAEITKLEEEFREKYDDAKSVDVVDIDDLTYKFYRDSWEKLPDFANLKPETVGKLPKGKFDLKPASRNTAIGFVYEGFLKVPKDGDYTFFLDSDDGSRLWVDGKAILEHDGIHGEGSGKSGKVALKAGRLPIKLEYFQNLHGLGLTVAWSGPGVPKRRLSTTESTGPEGKQELRNVRQAIARHPDVLGAKRSKQYEQLKHELDALKKESPAVDLALCVTENGPQAPDTFVLLRGNPRSLGPKVEPGFPELLQGGAAVVPAPAKDAKSTGRRTALADWIASPNNPLTARVYVNRIWQQHFGRGIVRSPNNFGGLGVPPTHPELLDWLSARLVADGWRIKPLHKLIMLSATYQMSSQGDPEGLARDPANDSFWRFDMRRLSAEEVRDSMLAVNGSLNTKMYGPGVTPEISAEVLAGQSVPGAGWGKASPEDSARRSIYIHVKRSLVMPILSTFDFPDTDLSCEARFVTTQPAQALGMLNGKFAHDEAAVFAARLKKEAPGDVQAQVRLGLRLALGRDAQPAEVDRYVKLIESLAKKEGQNADKALNLFCLTVYNLNEFMYLD